MYIYNYTSNITHIPTYCNTKGKHLKVFQYTYMTYYYYLPMYPLFFCMPDIASS